MSSINAREEITACYDALEAAVDAVVDLDCTALTTPERLALLERLETVHRRLPAVGCVNPIWDHDDGLTGTHLAPANHAL
ncbi:hypothetical protein B8W67_13430, partial [Mycolicibacillus koreensis]